ncbi:MAG: hypothetical protein ABI609_12245 [Acidobacteriota bacterium]
MTALDGSAAKVSCPQCGGENQLPSGTALLLCAFCGASIFVDRSQVVIHYRVPRLLDEPQARESLRRWMAGNDTVKDLDRLAVLGKVSALSFPMWLFRVRASQGESVRVEPAAATPIGELADLDLPAGKLEPYGDGEAGAQSIEVSVPLATAKTWLTQRAQAPGDRAEPGELAEQALVHVPLWRCEYQFNGKPYVALVEGSTGRAMASVYPSKAEAPYIAVAVLGFVVFLIEGFFFSNPLLKAVVFAATAVPMLGAAYWVTRRI